METEVKCYWVYGKDGEEVRCGLPAAKYVRCFGWLCCMHADEANRNYMSLAESRKNRMKGSREDYLCM